jgi:hypothetical protein
MEVKVRKTSDWSAAPQFLTTLDGEKLNNEIIECFLKSYFG